MRNLSITTLTLALMAFNAYAVDHNDPNRVNAMFSNVPVQATDIYGAFGWPSDSNKRLDKEKFIVVPQSQVQECLTRMLSINLS